MHRTDSVWNIIGRVSDRRSEMDSNFPLKQRWRVLNRTEAPAHIGRALLLYAVAYWLQERVLGGLKSSTRPWPALLARKPAAPTRASSLPDARALASGLVQDNVFLQSAS
jgi:hypothetical protein